MIEDLGTLSRDEQRLMHTPAADLIAFMDCERVQIVAYHKDDSYWTVVFFDGAVYATVRDAAGQIKFRRECSTLHEGLDAIRRFEQGRPL